MSDENTAEAEQPPKVGPFYYVEIDEKTNTVTNFYKLFIEATAANFREISQDDYDRLWTMPGAKFEDGKLVEYQPPVSFVSLQAQAGAALQKVQAQAAMAAALGEQFGPEMRSYVTQLREIVDGQNQSVKTLPIEPADPSK